MKDDDVNTGGQAFPVPHGASYKMMGMTLRDYFAGQAVAGLCAASDKLEDLEHVARLAYRIADDMLIERMTEEPLL